MRIILFPPTPGGLMNRMEAGNAHGTENCSLASRDLTVHLSSQLFRTPPAAWVSSRGGCTVLEAGQPRT